MKRIINLFICLILTMSLFACTGNANNQDLKNIKEKGNLVVGVFNYEPMNFKDDNGNWIGFDADMAKEFAKHIGVNVQVVEINWKDRVKDLNNKKIDCVWCGMSLTDSISKSVSCSMPYCDNSQVIVVKTEDEDIAANIDNLSKFKFAVVESSSGEEVAKANNYECVLVSSPIDALDSITRGESNACIIDILMADAVTGDGNAYPDLVYTGRLNKEELCVGFRKGSDMVDTFNNWYQNATVNGLANKIASAYGIESAIK